MMMYLSKKRKTPQMRGFSFANALFPKLKYFVLFLQWQTE